MKRISGLLLLLLLLSACASGGGTKSGVTEKLKQEMDAAVASNEVAKPETVDQALLPPLVVSPAQVDSKPLETKFDLAVNNTPAKHVFMAIVSGTRYSVLVHPDVSGTISLTLKDVTVFEALEAIPAVDVADTPLSGELPDRPARRQVFSARCFRIGWGQRHHDWFYRGRYSDSSQQCPRQ